MDTGTCGDVTGLVTAGVIPRSCHGLLNCRRHCALEEERKKLVELTGVASQQELRRLEEALAVDSGVVATAGHASVEAARLAQNRWRLMPTWQTTLPLSSCVKAAVVAQAKKGVERRVTHTARAAIGLHTVRRSYILKDGPRNSHDTFLEEKKGGSVVGVRVNTSLVQHERTQGT